MGSSEAAFFDGKLSNLQMTEGSRDELGNPIVFHPDRLTFSVDPSIFFGLQRMGDVTGKRILDCGCGSGFSSIYLAHKGARVYAFDVSVVAIKVTRQRACLNGVLDRVSVLCTSLHHLPYPDRFFDAVFGSFILHHVDLQAASEEIRRVLKKEGKAVFIENSSRNPVLMFARRHLVGRFWISKRGTLGEHPLTPGEITFLESRFNVEIHYADFVFFRMVDYLLPYRVFPWLGYHLDRLIYRLVPLARPYSYYLVCELTER